MSKGKVRIVVSIPIHEALDVACNQALNIKKYIPSVNIVFHISPSVKRNKDWRMLSAIPDVYINPEHLQTGWGNIIDAHLSNFRFICTMIEFDYFVMHSSNDMYVRTGLELYICQFQAGFNIRHVEDTRSLWIIAEKARNDATLKKLKKSNNVVASQIEGSFYRKNLMEQIVNEIEMCRPYAECIPYTREELFFSTAAYQKLEKSEIGNPTTFSEIHRFDRIYQRYYAVSNKLFGKNKNIKTKLMADEFVRRCLFRSRFYRITCRDIRHIRELDDVYIRREGNIDDGFGAFNLYDGNNVFSVKRVPRDLNNRIRKYINRLDKETEN